MGAFKDLDVQQEAAKSRRGRTARQRGNAFERDVAETIGGVLRNANRQERSEPANPREAVSIFNLSTIPPDTMRPKFEIQNEYK